MNESITKLTKKEIAKQYVKASVHYGHSPKEWNPKMAPYIYMKNMVTTFLI